MITQRVDPPTLGGHIESLPHEIQSSYQARKLLEDAYVLTGCGKVLTHGRLYCISDGDCIAFPAGTGVGHTNFNDEEWWRNGAP
jgi:uncharacterized cupin superfamily protein